MRYPDDALRAVIREISQMGPVDEVLACTDGQTRDIRRAIGLWFSQAPAEDQSKSAGTPRLSDHSRDHPPEGFATHTNCKAPTNATQNG